MKTIRNWGSSRDAAARGSTYFSRVPLQNTLGKKAPLGQKPLSAIAVVVGGAATAAAAAENRLILFNLYCVVRRFGWTPQTQPA